MACGDGDLETVVEAFESGASLDAKDDVRYLHVTCQVIDKFHPAPSNLFNIGVFFYQLFVHDPAAAIN